MQPFHGPSVVSIHVHLLLRDGIRWGLALTVPLAGALSLVLVFADAGRGEIDWMRVVAWLGLLAGTFAGGVGLAYLGDLNRGLRHKSISFRASTQRCKWSRARGVASGSF